MITALATQAYNALRHNRRRSLLTMLGMAWGIATVVLLLAYGTFLSEADDFTHTRVAVIGSDAKKKLFSGQNAVGQEIRINGISYQVVGILKHQVQNGDDNINENVSTPSSAMSDLANTYFLS